MKELSSPPDTAQDYISPNVVALTPCLNIMDAGQLAGIFAK